MVNRELIRLKTVQVVYSYYVNKLNETDTKSAKASEKELILSLDKAYELYHAMLSLLVEVRRVAIEDVDFKQMRNKQLGTSSTVDTRFADNRLLKQLNENEALREWRESNNAFWSIDEEMIKNFYRAFTQTSDYANYIEEEDTYKADQEMVRRFYRTMLTESDELSSALEDKSIYWNDDKFIIDTFVIKTLKLFKEDSTPEQPLLPQYEHPEDLQYALNLYRHAISNGDYYRSLIQQYAKGWDMHRIALMDIVIIQTALAEIIAFPTIPVAVSINEYINISKMYSTQRNWTYVNAALDNITKQLIAEHKIMDKK